MISLGGGGWTSTKSSTSRSCCFSGPGTVTRARRLAKAANASAASRLRRAVERRAAETAGAGPGRAEEHLPADTRTGDHGGDRHHLLGRQRALEGVPYLRRQGPGSNRSMKTSIVPPQDRPTLQAVSSLTP